MLTCFFNIIYHSFQLTLENDVQPQNDDQTITRNASSLSSPPLAPSSEASIKIGQLPREKDLHHFFKMGGFTGNPEKYAFTHYQSLLGNTEWVGDAFHILKLNIYMYLYIILMSNVQHN